MDAKLRESKTRGSFLFPFELYHMEDQTGTFYVSCHWHKDLELIYLKKGNIQLFLNGETFLVEEGTILFINREEIHALTPDTAEVVYDASVFPLEFLSFDFMDYCQQKYLLPFIQKQLLFPRFLRQEHPAYLETSEQLERIHRLLQDQLPGYQMGVKAALFQIISSLIHHDCMILPSDRSPLLRPETLDMMKQMISYLEDHLEEKLDLQTVSANFYMTPNYFCKFFKKCFGTSFTSYVNELRLEKACLLLMETDRPIMDIGFQCGFDNFSYFIRVFKKNKGITPSRFRKQLSP